MSADSGPGTREVARRLFAAEFDDASLSYSESDEERAPNYVVTPTGARVNRLFAAGVLTEVEQVNEDSVRGRIADPTGAFVTYAGQYQPDEKAFLDRTEPPAFVALSGKARTFEPEDSDRVFTSVRPESLNEVDADTRDRWVVSAARRTLHRIAVFAEALNSDLRDDDLREALEAEGVDTSLAAGIPKAIDHYGTGTAYLEAVRSLAVEAVEQVAGERDSVGTLETLPDDETPTELGALPDVDVSLEGYEPSGSEEAEPEVAEEAEAESATTESPAESTEPEPTESTEPDTETVSEEVTTEAEADVESEPETGAEPETEPEEPPTAAEPAVEETESEPAEPEPESADTEPEGQPSEPEPETTEDEELGDFDGESVQETVEQESEELGDFDPGETVDDGAGSDAPEGQSDAIASEDESEALSEEERKEVEEEFGAEFSTGSEVGEPGEAGIDVPTSEEELEELEEEVTGETTETDESTEAEAEEDTASEEAPEDVDLEDAVVETMKDLDEGDGVAHDALVDAVAEEYGVDAGAVEDAIQDAMMSGKCYEPEDGTLKAI